MVNRIELRPLKAGDDLPVSILLSTVFDSPEAPRMVAQLRKNHEMALELIGRQDDRTYGYIAFTCHPRPAGWWSLSMVAVSPAFQNEGLGGRLIRYGLDLARRAGAPAVTVQGDPRYYERFGFSRQAARNLQVAHGADMTMVYPFDKDTSGYAGVLSFPSAYSSF